MAPLLFQYLNLGKIAARGGAVRFFMLANGIPFEDELVSLEEWKSGEKGKDLKKINPCGTVPIVTLEDKKILIQHVSIMRYLAVTKGLASSDAFDNYVQDLVAEEYATWRHDWVAAAFGTPEAQAEFKTGRGPAILKMMEELIVLYQQPGAKGGPYLTGTSPSWGDSVVFGLVYDMCQTLLDEADVEGGSYPHVNALCQAYKAVPAVKAWIDA